MQLSYYYFITDFFTMFAAYPSISSSLLAVLVRSCVLPVVMATMLVAMVAAREACKQLMVIATIFSSRPRVIGSKTGKEKMRQTTETSFSTDCRLSQTLHSQGNFTIYCLIHNCNPRQEREDMPDKKTSFSTECRLSQSLLSHSQSNFTITRTSEASLEDIHTAHGIMFTKQYKLAPALAGS